MNPALLFAVFALALTAACFNANAEVINIGISTVGLYELPTEISKRRGFYQEEGLDAPARSSCGRRSTSLRCSRASWTIPPSRESS